MFPAQYAMNEYRQTTVDAGAAYADPHMLVSMLLNGLQEKLAIARGALERKDYAEKGEALGRAVDIVGYLQGCLDLEKGGELAIRLDGLYDYAAMRLLEASAANDAAIVSEVQGIVEKIQSSWDAIREEAVKMAPPAPEMVEMTG